jgi:DNA-binding LacI/PurR family transcriptional regulator
MATIKDVAARANVSTATVSHVINDSRNTKPQTRARVLAAIRELGYARNAAARSLVTGRSRLFGMIVSDFCNPFFPEVAAAFQDQALLNDVDALVMNANFDPHRTVSCVRRMLGLQIPAVALITSQIDPQVCDLLLRNQVSAVYLDLGQVGPFVSNIFVNYEHGVGAAVEHLVALGHRRIGYIGGSRELPSVARRQDAFLAAAANVEGLEAATAECDFTTQGGYVACARLLARLAPTAVMAVNDVVAIGAMHCAFDRGLEVPRDLSIVGFDDITFAEYAHPTLTTVRIPRSSIGKLAFQALTAMLAEPERPGAEHIVETSLVVRESTAAPTALGDRAPLIQETS